MLADRHGAFLGLGQGRSYGDVKLAYFYDTDEKIVTFK